MAELDDFLQHYGVLGMKWGKRKKSSSSQKADKKPGRIKQTFKSLKREREWKKVTKQVHQMSTKDINKVTQRIQLENDLKRLSKNKKVASKKDREDYRLREKMSDQELHRKVTRLRAKDNLHRAVNEASREQRELGMKVVQVGGGLGMKYAMTGRVTTNDVFKTVTTDVKAAKAQARQQAKDNIEKRLGDRVLVERKSTKTD